MSAELIAHWAWVKPGASVDWQRAHAAVDNLTDEDLDTYAGQAAGCDAEGMGGADSVRGEIRTFINTLTDTDFVVVESPSGDIAHLTGGTSSGDDPNEDYTAMTNLSVLPTLWDTAGYRTDETTPGPSYADLLAFANQVAGWIKDGEDDGDGGEFILENDDAVDTLHSAISMARALLNQPQHNDPEETS